MADALATVCLCILGGLLLFMATRYTSRRRAARQAPPPCVAAWGGTRCWLTAALTAVAYATTLLIQRVGGGYPCGMALAGAVAYALLGLTAAPAERRRGGGTAARWAEAAAAGQVPPPALAKQAWFATVHAQRRAAGLRHNVLRAECGVGGGGGISLPPRRAGGRGGRRRRRRAAPRTGTEVARDHATRRTAAEMAETSGEERGGGRRRWASPAPAQERGPTGEGRSAGGRRRMAAVVVSDGSES